MRHTVFLFGEAERGDFCTPLVCRSLPQLAETVGNPPEESQGILYAVQALLFQRELIFFALKGILVPSGFRGKLPRRHGPARGPGQCTGAVHSH